MRYSELLHRLGDLVSEPSTVAHLISLAQPGEVVSPTIVALAQQPDGSFVVYLGDLRDTARPALDEAGVARRIPTEDEACDWAWDHLRESVRPPAEPTASQRGEAEASGERQKQRAKDLFGR